MLAAFTNFLTSCNAIVLSPAPAIAQSISIAARDDLLKCGRIVTQVCLLELYFEKLVYFPKVIYFFDCCIDEKVSSRLSNNQ